MGDMESDQAKTIRDRIDAAQSRLAAAMAELSEARQKLQWPDSSRGKYLEAFFDLAAEAKFYVDRWPKLAPEIVKRLAAMCPEGREWNPVVEVVDGTEG